MRRIPVTAALLAATLAAVALPAAASADPYWHGGGDGRGWDRDRGGWDRGRDYREWREHEWREHHRFYGYGYGGYYARPYDYARPPVVYGGYGY